MKPSLKEQLETVRAELGVPALGALVGDSRSVRAFASVGVRRAGSQGRMRRHTRSTPGLKVWYNKTDLLGEWHSPAARNALSA